MDRRASVRATPADNPAMKHSLIPGRASMSLGQRFAFGFGLILALLMLVTAVSQWLVGTVSDHMKGIVEVHNRQMALANTMIDQVNDMAITLRTLTLLPDVKEVDKQVKLLQQNTEAYTKTERELAS